MQHSLAKRKILVVDDTLDMLELISVVLEGHGFEVITACGGAEMDVEMQRHKFDLIILDTMMPVEDGFSICKRLSQRAAPPIIMLSAKSMDVDRIKGLNLGAEDYIAKPFHPDELVARIGVALRRSQPSGVSAKPGLDRFYGWTLDPVTRKITSPDTLSYTLSAAEFAVIRVILDHPDRPLKREFMLAKMAELHEDSNPRALDTIVSRLRRKLGEIHPTAGPDDELIRTVYGVGYMLRPPLAKGAI
ncbi:response regulator [Asticcacaulis sp. AC402]|uniref:response regulator n=1 Tax=Asticcacaulis sp. AC402 TaxID=1282361 RepID=UPI0003C3EB10|nr:response regulator transcription factor [Asticcacaulis sp. AC402]ESQ77121.1 hypothetical protein ABAC402_01615 [Asticcacaulis sp. AC402]